MLAKHWETVQQLRLDGCEVRGLKTKEGGAGHPVTKQFSDRTPAITPTGMSSWPHELAGEDAGQPKLQGKRLSEGQPYLDALLVLLICFLRFRETCLWHPCPSVDAVGTSVAIDVVKQQAQVQTSGHNGHTMDVGLDVSVCNLPAILTK